MAPFNPRYLQKTAEGDIASSMQRLYSIRSKSLSGGSFRDGSVVLEHKKPLTEQRTIQYSLPPALEESVCSSIGGNSTDQGTTCDKLPDDSVLQFMISELSDIEKEAAACSSYFYSQLSAEASTRGSSLDALRDTATKEMAARHWIAEKGDTETAMKMFRKTIQHRIEFKVDDIRKCFEEDSEWAKATRCKVEKYIGPKGRMFVRGFDKDGRCTFHFVGKNSPEGSKTDHEGCLEAHYYILEKAIAATEQRTNGQQSMVNVSVDFDDFKKWHAPPIGLCKDMLAMLKVYYPERLWRVYLIDAPAIFRGIWTLLKPFIDPVTKTKFQFVTGEQQRMAMFGEVLDKSQALPYQRPDGELTDNIDMQEFFEAPFNQAYRET